MTPEALSSGVFLCISSSSMVEEDVQPLNVVLQAAMKGRLSAMVVPAVLFVQKKILLSAKQ